MSRCNVPWCRAEAYPGSEWCQFHEVVNPFDDTPRDCDSREARMDRETERIMKMTVEEMAAEEGKTVEQLLEEGRKFGEECMARIRQRYPEFGK